MDQTAAFRGDRLEQLLAASRAPPPSSARTARPYLPITHGVEHGEPAAESAVVGLAGTVDGEQCAATPLGCLALREVGGDHAVKAGRSWDPIKTKLCAVIPR